MSMPLIPRSQLTAWVSEANRAPSVHNVQPARWEWSINADGMPSVRLYSDQARRLLASDPLRQDEGTSLGAAWEGLRLAVERDGYTLEAGGWLDPGLSEAHPAHPELRLVTSARLRPVAPGFVTRDPLVDFVFKRKTWRGKFLPALPSQLGLLESALPAGQYALLLDRRSRARVARLLADATARIARHEAAQRELLQWLRFSPADARYHEDGLNAESLGIPRPFARAAGAAMRIGSHPVVLKTGLNRVLFDESPQLSSASAILVLYAPVGADAPHRGRLLYRAWLQAARYGLSACPMSVLADDPATAAALLAFHPEPSTVSVLNVLRVGMSPEPVLPLTPRLQPERLVIR